MNRPGDWVRRGVAAGVVVVAILLLVFALRPAPAPGETASGARLATPLWSSRRLPDPIVDAAGVQRLETALRGDTAGTEACWSVDQDGRTVTTTALDAPLVPASTQKLLTGAAALDALGPDTRFRTQVLGGPVQGGTVARLHLVGGGDPTLATPEGIAAVAADPVRRGDVTTSLDELAARIAAAGVRNVPGGIVVDDSRYDALRTVAGWPARYATDFEIGPIGALTVDDGFTDPRGPRGPVPDPALHAGQQLARLLAARGVTVGGVTRGAPPAGAGTVATIDSAPLHDVVASMISSSDNLTAEMLAKEVAVRARQPGTTAAGVEAVSARLQALGIPMTGVRLVDGSGLSRDDRATCRALVTVLDRSRRPRLRAVRDGLSVVGQRGTLATRLAGTPVAGRLAAKTGSLAGVSALAGYIDGRRALRFATLMNGTFGESEGLSRRERFALHLAPYPDVPDGRDTVPSPDAPTGR